MNFKVKKERKGYNEAEHSWVPGLPSHCCETSLAFFAVLITSTSCCLWTFSHRLQKHAGVEGEGVWFTVRMKQIKKEGIEKERTNPEANKPKIRVWESFRECRITCQELGGKRQSSQGSQVCKVRTCLYFPRT